MQPHQSITAQLTGGAFNAAPYTKDVEPAGALLKSVPVENETVDNASAETSVAAGFTHFPLINE